MAFNKQPLLSWLHLKWCIINFLWKQTSDSIPVVILHCNHPPARILALIISHFIIYCYHDASWWFKDVFIIFFFFLSFRIIWISHWQQPFYGYLCLGYLTRKYSGKIWKSSFVCLSVSACVYVRMEIYIWFTTLML